MDTVLTPLEKLGVISKDGIHETPLEILVNATSQHFQEDKEFQASIHETLKEISGKLDPIVETYKSMRLLGRWGIAGLGIVAMLATIWHELRL